MCMVSKFEITETEDNPFVVIDIEEAPIKSTDPPTTGMRKVMRWLINMKRVTERKATDGIASIRNLFTKLIPACNIVLILFFTKSKKMEKNNQRRTVKCMRKKRVSYKKKRYVVNRNVPRFKKSSHFSKVHKTARNPQQRAAMRRCRLKRQLKNAPNKRAKMIYRTKLIKQKEFGNVWCKKMEVLNEVPEEVEQEMEKHKSEKKASGASANISRGPFEPDVVIGDSNMMQKTKKNATPSIWTTE
ncbi:uncharacterized protein isoform X2 [Rhodnius prolixus]|uniref:uncharacterized protein isoform X2 n=1 Tax=Rhodnius prolixus TaxID=13249 RepID=UPI003D188B1C